MIEELPLGVAADYDPARMVFDAHSRGAGSGTIYPNFTVLTDGVALARDGLNSSTTPIAIQPGGYMLHAFMADTSGSAVKGPTCDKPVTVASRRNVAYTANFTGSTCSWGPGDSRF